jgi:hypothetical protein
LGSILGLAWTFGLSAAGCCRGTGDGLGLSGIGALGGVWGAADVESVDKVTITGDGVLTRAGSMRFGARICIKSRRCAISTTPMIDQRSQACNGRP